MRKDVMRRCCVGLFVFVVALCVSFTMTAAARAEEPARIITLDEARKIALEHNRDIQKAYEYRKKVRGVYVEQRAYALPQLTAQVTGGRSWDEAQAAAQSFSFVLPIPGNPVPVNFKVPPDGIEKAGGISLTQPLYTWGQVGAAIKGAKFGMKTAEDEIRMYRQAALRDVSTSFYDVLLVKEMYAIALQNLQQKTAHLDQAQRKFRAGVATEYDVLAAEVAVKNAKPDVIRTENQIRLARERLRFLLGIAEEIDVAGELGTPDHRSPVYEEILDTAYDKRPEIAELRNRVGMAGELVKVYSAGDKPRVDFKATGGYRVLTSGSEDYDGKTWSVGLAITFPFFDGFRTRGKVAQAKSDVATLKIEEAKALDSIALQVRDSVNAVNEAANIVQALAGTVSQAEKLLSMAEKGYEYGVKTRLDVDDAALNLVAAKGSFAKAKRDYLAAAVTLTWATGVLGEEE